MSGAADGLKLGDNTVIEDTLGHLAKKTGVKATLLLDRATGTILKMEGQVTSLRTAASGGDSRRNGGSSSSKDNDDEETAATAAAAAATTDSNNNTTATVDEAATPTAAAAAADETRGARELAALVWAYVKTSSELVEAIETEDELKLLRLRTKRQQLVIVPDARYVLIVVHDTPPAKLLS